MHTTYINKLILILCIINFKIIHAKYQPSFSHIAKKAIPAVVNIYSSKQVVNRDTSFFSDPMFEYLFQARPSKKLESSLGSGVMVNSKGLIVTNAHVVQSSESITAVLNDGQELTAKILIIDESSDLALLQIQNTSKTFSYLTFANSDEVDIGDVVLAIGNPFGIGQTITSGIVSSLSRTSFGAKNYDFFIQTDANIHPGNSGGALLDMNGQVIGINTAIYTKNGSAMGIGFAIPSNMVKALINNTKTHNGKTIFVKPWLGADIKDLNQQTANDLGMERPSGVIVNKIYNKGSISESNVQLNDIITAINNKEIKNKNELYYKIHTKSLGEVINLSIIRKKQHLTIPIKLIAQEETPPRDLRVIKTNCPLYGATIANLSPILASELGMDENIIGVVILNSSSHFSNIIKKDIILKINNINITSTRELEEILSKIQGKKWHITVNRQGYVLNLNYIM